MGLHMLTIILLKSMVRKPSTLFPVRREILMEKDGWNAYKKALEEHGMEIEDHRIYFGDYHPKSGMEAVEFFADSGLDMPDAIMAANDEMALGALYELERRGYRIPEDIMITGYVIFMRHRTMHPVLRVYSVRRRSWDVRHIPI